MIRKNTVLKSIGIFITIIILYTIIISFVKPITYKISKNPAVSIHKLDETFFENHDSISLNRYCGMSEDNISDIKEHMNDYKLLIIPVDVINRSFIYDFNKITTDVNFNSKLEKSVICYNQGLEGDCMTGATYVYSIGKDCFFKHVVIKTDGKTDDELIKLAKKTKFTIHGEFKSKVPLSQRT